MGRWVRWAVALSLATPLVTAAQTELPVSATAALEHGTLVVWVVSPASAAEKARIAALKRGASVPVLPTTLQQQTAGSFGQTASSIGQTAGSYGRSASDTGQTASSTGQTAGGYGVSPSELGTASSNVGTTAGSYGQTAGSFGTASSNAGQTAGSYAGTLPAREAVSGQGAPTTMVARELSNQLQVQFPGLQLKVIDMSAEELMAALELAKPEEFPDVVIAAVLPQWWDESGVGVTMLGWPVFPEQSATRTGPVGRAGTRLTASDRTQHNEAERVVVLRRAKHREVARAFIVWLRDEGVCRRCELKREKSAADEPVEVAKGALLGVLNGGVLGMSADAEAAVFNGPLAQRLALSPPAPDALGGLGFRVDVLSADANDRLAVVALRAIAAGPGTFGVAHALVVLRKDEQGRWKVLQLSPNMSPARLLQARDELAAFAKKASPAKVVGVSLASPPDGDNRQRQPELWWDNGSDAGLLVVEWQTKFGEWTDSRLMLVPDRDPRVQTRVVAGFATGGQYRWRVWAVGTGGVVVVSPWRRLNVVP